MLSSTVLLSALPLLALVTPTVALGSHQGRDHSRMQRVRKARAMNKRACKVRSSSLASSWTSTTWATSTTPTPSPTSYSSDTTTYYAAPTTSSDAAADANQYAAVAAAVVTSSSTWVAPATTSSYTAPAATTPASSGGGSTQGWGDNNPSWINNNLFKTCSKWVYNWSAWHQDIYQQLGIEFVPQLWGADASHVADFNQNVGTYKALGVKYILGFNEPDQTAQSNLSPQAAADAWWANMSPHANDFTLVGPALTSSADNTAWYASFMNILGNDAPEHVALHYYGTDAQDMINYIQTFAATWNYSKKIWVTEFACQDFTYRVTCDADQASAFMYTVVTWMNQQDYIFRHAWFGALTDMSNVADSQRLLSADGQSLTNLGNQYFW